MGNKKLYYFQINSGKIKSPIIMDELKVCFINVQLHMRIYIYMFIMHMDLFIYTQSIIDTFY